MKYLTAGILVINLLLVGFLVLNFNKKPSIGFVNNQVLFDEFNGTKDYKSKLDRIQLNSKSKMDSLNLTLQRMSNSSIPNQLQLMQKIKEEIVMLRTNSEAQYEIKSQEFTEIIWNQINQFLEDFGEEKNIGLIVGAKGNGEVMYGADQLNLTTEILNYINDKYEGS